MKNNAELQADVQNAINWEPLLNAAEIVVSTKHDVVSLTVTVNLCYQKEEAECIAWNAIEIWHVKNKSAFDYEFANVDLLI
jgi:osmotically-inducible protein OsmY